MNYVNIFSRKPNAKLRGRRQRCGLCVAFASNTGDATIYQHWNNVLFAIMKIAFSLAGWYIRSFCLCCGRGLSRSFRSSRCSDIVNCESVRWAEDSLRPRPCIIPETHCVGIIFSWQPKAIWMLGQLLQARFFCKHISPSAFLRRLMVWERRSVLGIPIPINALYAIAVLTFTQPETIRRETITNLFSGRCNSLSRRAIWHF